MGLIRAALNAAGSVMADQWKEFFYCEAIDNNTLVVKGQKRTGRGSQNRGSDNIISNGSGIAVADGQCMIIVEQGKIVDICAEPGEYTYDTSSEPSIFSGKLGTSILDTFKAIGKRFSYGGDTGKDQRIYYFNVKEILDNKFGTANPIPFRVVDSKIGLDVDVSLRCSGVYSYRITNPILFYTNVCGNVSDDYTRRQIDEQLKSEFMSALQPAFGKLSDMELRPNQIITHNEDLEKALNDKLSSKWADIRGIEVVTVALRSVTLPDEDAEMIKTLQKTAVFTNLNMAAASRVEAQNEAMKTAAGNSAGAMTGFMGFNMAQQQSGGMDVNQMYQMGQQQQAQAAQMQAQSKAAGTWTCKCGAENTGNFCMNCGEKKPAPAGTWTCSCGTENTGNFCMNCGSKKPVADGPWTCSCGTENTGKFCMNCGKPRA